MTAEPVDDLGDSIRTVLAGWLVGAEVCTPAEAVTRYGLDNLLAECEREGVISLVHARLVQMGAAAQVPPELMQAITAPARMCAARSLLCMSEARRIQQALAQAGVPTLWLKGIALGDWLYASAHLRDIADIDLLLPDHASTLLAAEVLAPLGYALPNAHIAGDLVVHELLAYSERVRLELDLHWDLSNGALFAERLPWTTLVAEAIPLPSLGENARGLSPLHALLHACMHLAAGRLVWPEDRLRWLYDIHLLALRLDAASMARLPRAAADARLADASAYALRSCRRVFETAVGEALLAQLDAAAAAERVCTSRLHRWAYFQWACWQRWPDLRTRLQWLRQMMFPDWAHLHQRYGSDGASPLEVAARRAADGCRRWWGYVLQRNR